METRFNFKSLDEIEASLTEQGVALSSTDTSVDTPGNTPSKRPRTTLHREQEKALRRLYVNAYDNNNDPLPLEYRHLRDSELKVKDKVYTTVAALVGIGLSVTEASKSVVEVGQGLFDRKEWKEFGDTVILLIKIVISETNLD